jgi:NADH-quinone oxidoreductase subunit A
VDDFLRSYLTVGLVCALGVAVPLIGLGVGRLIRANRPSEEKATTYESGAEPTAGGWSQTHVRYYLYALLFVVFDVEVAFVIPWAVDVEGFGVFGLVEMLVFVAILALGLAYAWRKGVFDWDS